MTPYQSLLLAKESSPRTKMQNLNRTYDEDISRRTYRPDLQLEQSEFKRNKSKNIVSQIDIDGFRSSAPLATSMMEMTKRSAHPTD